MTTRKLLGIDVEKLTIEQEDRLQEFKRIFFNEFGLVLKFEISSHNSSNYYFTDQINPYKAICVMLNYTTWDWDTIISTSRKEEVVFYRSVIAYILYNNNCGINEIAKILNKDHSTIINSLRTFNVRLDMDTYAKKFLKDVAINLKEHYRYSEVETKEQMLQILKNN